MGNEKATSIQIQAAAKQANAHDFVTKLPNNYKTLVGDRGAQLSGGQKQRIAIARALIKDPKILLLDEATSALDTQSESIVQHALDKAREGRTTIIVAHRLTTIRSADKIIVLDNGVVAEVGSHEDLMAKNGLYFQLVTAQTVDEEADYSGKFDPSKNDEKTAPQSKRLRLQSEHIDDVVVVPTEEKSGNKKEDLPKPSLVRIMKLNAKEWPLIVIGTLASAANGISMPAYAILFGEVLSTLGIPDDDEAKRESMKYSDTMHLIEAELKVSPSSYKWSKLKIMMVFMFGIAGEKLTMRIRKLVFGTMLRQEMGWFDMEENSTGALCARLASDASSIQGATGSRVGTVTQSLASVGSGIGLSLYYSWKLGLVVIAFVPFVVISTYYQSKIVFGQNILEKEQLEKSSKAAVEAIGNIRTVAGLRREQYFHKVYMAALLQPHQAATKKAHLRGAIFGLAQSVPFFAYAATMFYGGKLIEDDGLDYASVFKVSEALIACTVVVGQALAFAPNFDGAMVSSARVFKLLDRKTLIDPSDNSGKNLQGVEKGVAFKDVEFTYPSRPDAQILKKLCLDIQAGKTIALVGSSGCGKSTTIQLLERFYDPSSGSVNVEDNNITDLNISSLRSKLGLVSQEPILFDRSIAENIAYGDNYRTVPMEEIIEAAKSANIHNFITSLPKASGYETRVGDKGTQLSGGQKQRVAIARALLRNPAILLLDEATSALDSEKEVIMEYPAFLWCIFAIFSSMEIANCAPISAANEGNLPKFQWPSGALEEILGKMSSNPFEAKQLLLKAKRDVDDLVANYKERLLRTHIPDWQEKQVERTKREASGNIPALEGSVKVFTGLQGEFGIQVKNALHLQIFETEPNKVYALAATGTSGSQTATIHKLNPQALDTLSNPGQVDLFEEIAGIPGAIANNTVMFWPVLVGTRVYLIAVQDVNCQLGDCKNGGTPVFELDIEKNGIRYVQTLPVSHGVDVASVTAKTYLAFASNRVTNDSTGITKYTLESNVYEFYETHVDSISTFTTTGAVGITAFKIGLTQFVCTANAQDDFGNTKVLSKCWQWNPALGKLEVHQTFLTDQAFDVEHTKVSGSSGTLDDSKHLLIFGTHETVIDEPSNHQRKIPKLVIYAWDGQGYWFPFQCLEVLDVGRLVTLPEIPGTEQPVICIAMKTNGLECFVYNGWKFAPMQQPLTADNISPGLNSVTITHLSNGDTFLAAANAFSDGSTVERSTKAPNVFKMQFEAKQDVQNFLASTLLSCQRVTEDLKKNVNVTRMQEAVAKLPKRNGNDLEIEGTCALQSANIGHLYTRALTVDKPKTSEEKTWNEKQSSSLRLLQRIGKQLKTQLRKVQNATSSMTTAEISTPVEISNMNINCLDNAHKEICNSITDIKPKMINGEPAANLEHIVLKDHNYTFDEIQFKNLAVPSLVTNFLNGVPTGDLLTKTGDHEVTSHMVHFQNVVHINKDATIKGLWDKAKMSQLADCSSPHLEFPSATTPNLVVEKDLQIDNVDNISLAKTLDDAVPLNSKERVFVATPLIFSAASADALALKVDILETEEICGVNPKTLLSNSLLKSNEPGKVQEWSASNIEVDHFVVNDFQLNSGTENSGTLIVKNLLSNGSLVRSPEATSDVNWEELFKTCVPLKTMGSVTFKEVIIQGNNSKVNSVVTAETIMLQDLVMDTATMKLPEIVLNGRRTLTNPKMKFMRGLSIVKVDHSGGNLNNQPDTLFKNTLYTRIPGSDSCAPQKVEAKTTVAGHLQVHNLRYPELAETIGPICTTGDKLCRTPLVTFSGDVTVQNCMVTDFLDGISMTGFPDNLWQVSKDHVFTGNVQISGEVRAPHGVSTGDQKVSGFPVNKIKDDLVACTGAEKCVINAGASFGTVEAPGVHLEGSLNGINFPAEVLKKSDKVLTFESPVHMVGGVGFDGKINLSNATIQNKRIDEVCDFANSNFSSLQTVSIFGDLRLHNVTVKELLNNVDVQILDKLWYNSRPANFTEFMTIHNLSASKIENDTIAGVNLPSLLKNSLKHSQDTPQNITADCHFDQVEVKDTLLDSAVIVTNKVNGQELKDLLSGCLTHSGAGLAVEHPVTVGACKFKNVNAGIMNNLDVNKQLLSVGQPMTLNCPVELESAYIHNLHVDDGKLSGIDIHEFLDTAVDLSEPDGVTLSNVSMSKVIADNVWTSNDATVSGTNIQSQRVWKRDDNFTLLNDLMVEGNFSVDNMTLKKFQDNNLYNSSLVEKNAKKVEFTAPVELKGKLVTKNLKIHSPAVRHMKELMQETSDFESIIGKAKAVQSKLLDYARNVAAPQAIAFSHYSRVCSIPTEASKVVSLQDGSVAVIGFPNSVNISEVHVYSVGSDGCNKKFSVECYACKDVTLIYSQAPNVNYLMVAHGKHQNEHFGSTLYSLSSALDSARLLNGLTSEFGNNKLVQIKIAGHTLVLALEYGATSASPRAKSVIWELDEPAGMFNSQLAAFQTLGAVDGATATFKNSTAEFQLLAICQSKAEIYYPDSPVYRIQPEGDSLRVDKLQELNFKGGSCRAVDMVRFEGTLRMVVAVSQDGGRDSRLMFYWYNPELRQFELSEETKFELQGMPLEVKFAVVSTAELYCLILTDYPEENLKRFKFKFAGAWQEDGVISQQNAKSFALTSPHLPHDHYMENENAISPEERMELSAKNAIFNGTSPKPMEAFVNIPEVVEQPQANIVMPKLCDERPIDGFLLGIIIHQELGQQPIDSKDSLPTSGENMFSPKAKGRKPTQSRGNLKPNPRKFAPEKPFLQSKMLFNPGLKGYSYFKTPAIVRTRTGTLLAFAEARKSRSAKESVILVRRSVNHGTTWSRAAKLFKGSAKRIVASPAPVADLKTGTVSVLFVHYSSEAPGDQNSSGKKSRRSVHVIQSQDDGIHWKKPVQITKSAMKKSWKSYVTGPGHGIQLSSGRLLVPAFYTKAKKGTKGKKLRSRAHVLYSDDGGTTWHRGGPSKKGTGESSIAELSEGLVVLNSLQTLGNGKRVVAYSKDGGVSFPLATFDQQLPEAKFGSPGSILNVVVDQKKKTLVFLQPVKSALVLKSSNDEGKTWTKSKILSVGRIKHSDLVLIKPGFLGAVFDTKSGSVCLPMADNRAFELGAHRLQQSEQWC
ncbi:unnamed protein product [Notodromas monacha]|uniref:Uncharacterized protein n=1 Tax=Notodromas monacha TaxID=399045 RepID=A0A7R9BC10_9CRUS|nr:unnamed protein product [Notodromas monacha]CAG0912522.1 unnamed protein product [Notodromas monacha]